MNTIQRTFFKTFNKVPISQFSNVNNQFIGNSCKDCKHISNNKRCMRFIDSQNNNSLAIDCRRDENACGAKGVYFEQKSDNIGTYFFYSYSILLTSYVVHTFVSMICK